MVRGRSVTKNTIMGFVSEDTFFYTPHVRDGVDKVLEGLIVVMWSTMLDKNNVLRRGLLKVRVFS